MDAKLRYKAKKIKIVFFDIDDTLRNSKTGFIPASIPTSFIAEPCSSTVNNPTSFGFFGSAILIT